MLCENAFVSAYTWIQPNEGEGGNAKSVARMMWWPGLELSPNPIRARIAKDTPQ